MLLSIKTAFHFIHKTNPMSAPLLPKARVWRKQGEGLKLTAKGSKDLPGGRRLHVIVAIAHGKGVVLREANDTMNAGFFAKFISNHFNACFACCRPKRNGQRLFVMDNDPSQPSRAALNAIDRIEAQFHKIPSTSPDLTPIESVFHFLKWSLENEAVSSEITHECIDDFKSRVYRALDNLSIDVIDCTIESMCDRIDTVIRSGGHRTKY